MINTENNESVLDVVQKKKIIQNLYSKIENLENEVEFGELLTCAVLKSAKNGYDYHKCVKLTNEEMNPNPSFLNTNTNISIRELKLPFFKKVAIKAYEMDDDSRDIFWSMIYTIIKLSNTMQNKDDFEALQLYRSWEHFTGATDGFYKFSVNWITNAIKNLYSEVELRKVLSVFDSGYDDTINYLVENIVKKTETELPFQDPCLVNVLSDLLDFVSIFVNLDDIKFSNINSDYNQSIKFDFAEIVAPSFCDIQDNGSDPYKVTERKIFIGKFFQLVIQDIYLESCENGSEGWKLLNKYKKRFFSDKYLIEFLKSRVEEYSKEYLLKQV